MANPDPDFLSIGTFSRVTRLSQKALRLYGSLNLLLPAWIDPDSGYRYYRSEQVRDDRLIRSLREIGMPLATIRRVLGGSPREAQSLMRSHVTSLEEQARKARTALPDLVAETVAFSRDPLLMDMELGILVAAPIRPDGRITPGALPAGRYASLVYTGRDRGYAGNGVLINWAQKQGLKWDAWDDPAGHAFACRYESFLTDPTEEPDHKKWQTEVAIKLADE
jgi:DNA-binding transcriptional MerR regulator